MTQLRAGFNTVPVAVIATGDLPRRRAAATPQCPRCGRFGFDGGSSYTLIHRAHCVIAEGLRAQHDLDAARFLADNRLTEFPRAVTGFERLDAEIRGEFLPPDATTIVHRESVLAGPDPTGARDRVTAGCFENPPLRPLTNWRRPR